MSEYKIGTIRQPKGEPVTTYASEPPERTETHTVTEETTETTEPAKPIEGDTPLPLEDEEDTEDEE